MALILARRRCFWFFFFRSSLPDAPMCGCIEGMPEVSRADYSMNRPSNEGRFKACRNNDLRTHCEIVYPDASLANLVEHLGSKPPMDNPSGQFLSLFGVGLRAFILVDLRDERFGSG